MPEVDDPAVVPDLEISDDTKKILGNIMRPRENPDETPGEPPMWAVILWNDNSTDPRFVVRILVEAFKMQHQAASKLMFATHLGTKNVVMVVARDEAETRLGVAQGIIATATPNRDFYPHMSRSGSCELTFTIEEETKGKKT